MIPYGLWTFVGSMPTNPAISYHHARTAHHAGCGLSALAASCSLSGGIACALLLVVLGGLSTRLVIIHRLTPPPRLQVVQYVLAHFEPQSTRLYAWGTRRMFAFYAPTFDVHQRHDLPAARRHLEASSRRPSTLLVTSTLLAFPSPDVHLVQLFQRDRYVHNPHWQQGLYRWFPWGYRRARCARGVRPKDR